MFLVIAWIWMDLADTCGHLVWKFRDKWFHKNKVNDIKPSDM